MASWLCWLQPSVTKAGLAEDFLFLPDASSFSCSSPTPTPTCQGLHTFAAFHGSFPSWKQACPKLPHSARKTAWQVPLLAFRLPCVPRALAREDSSFSFLFFFFFCPQGPCSYFPPWGVLGQIAAGLRVEDIDLRAEAALEIAGLCGEGAQHSQAVRVHLSGTSLWREFGQSTHT